MLCKDTKSFGKLDEFRRENKFCHTEITESTEMGPSQMAIIGHTDITESTDRGHHRWRDMGSPEGEKLQENLIQNYTKYKGAAPEGVN